MPGNQMAKPKHVRKRLPSKRGRPRKEGDRHPNGELVRPKPNATLIAQRKALCERPEDASTPLDCATGNGWLNKRERATGQRYASIYAQAGFRVGSTTANASMEVDAESELTKLSLSQMTHADIVAAWDKVMARPVRLGTGSDGGGLDVWRRVNMGLSAPQRQQVFLVCVLDGWPQWLVQRLQAKTLRQKAEARAKAEKNAVTDEELALIWKREHSHWERSREHLRAALAIIHAVLHPAAPVAPYVSAPYKPNKRSESTTYVDTEGNFIREVVRIVAVSTAS